MHSYNSELLTLQLYAGLCLIFFLVALAGCWVNKMSLSKVAFEMKEGVEHDW